MAYNISKWLPIHNKIVELMAKGLPDEEISSRVGISVRTLTNIKSNENFKARLEDVHGKLKSAINEKIVKSLTDSNIVEESIARLRERIPEAERKIVRLMRGGKGEHRLQFDAAKEILHMAGLKPPEITEIRTREYTLEETQSAAKVAKELLDITERLNNHKNRFVLSKEERDMLEGISKDNPVESPLTDESSGSTEEHRQDVSSA